MKAAAKKQRRQANEELKTEHEERAKQVTAASLANVRLNRPSRQKSIIRAKMHELEACITKNYGETVVQVRCKGKG